MPNNDIQWKMNRYQEKSLLRKRIAISARHENKIIINNQPCINFCSNDYLGLSTHPDVKKAFIRGVEEYGVGSGSSALVSGYFSVQQELEETFAAFVNRDKALLFNSGYLANLGLFSALVERHGTIISDKLCHASLLDGIKLSNAKHYRYRHNDINHLENLLESSPQGFIVTESVFSMEGDIAPLKQIIKLAQASGAPVIVDDAHGIGVLGVHGRGICEQLMLDQHNVDCLITPLGKAFGSIGAIISGSENMIETILQFSRSYRYTTALPPAICVAILQVLDIIRTQAWRRARLNELIIFFIQQAHLRQLPLMTSDITPIKCLLVPDNDVVQQIQSHLQQNGFFVSAIRPPTVPEGSARIRISLNCLHTEPDIINLLDRLVELLC